MKKEEPTPDCWWWIASLFMVFILVVIATGCSREEVVPVSAQEGLPATIRLEVKANQPVGTRTRAVDESAIHDLHVLVYNNRGELIGKKYTIGSSLNVETRSGNNCTIYVIANTGSATLFDATVVSTEEKLKTLTTEQLSSWDELTNNTHLVMSGSKTGINIAAGTPSSNTIGNIAITRIPAKVTLKLSTEASSKITIHNYRIYGLPKQAYYIARPMRNEVGTTPGTSTDPDVSGSGDDAVKPVTPAHWISSKEISVEAANKDISFYMYENRRGVRTNITAQKDKVKVNAPDSATYVVINGETNGYKYTWYVYLGANNSSNFNMKRNCNYTYNIKLKGSGTDTRITETDMFQPLTGGNANCYMVTPGGSVNIPVERANESPLELDESTYNPNTQTYYQLFYDTHWTAEIVWQTAPGLISISNGSGTGLGSFTVRTTTIAGNAVVCIKSGAHILWSWHIWITPYNGGTTFKHNKSSLNNPTFMDRALGAYSATAGEISSCGLYYQWGRKDPFPGISQTGGSWDIPNNTVPDPIKVYDALGSAYMFFKIHVPSDVTLNNLTNAIRFPDTFYYSKSLPNDWFTYTNSFAQNDDLWSGYPITLPNVASKSVFDPCPAGWRVPPWVNNTSPFIGMDSGYHIENKGYTLPETGPGGYFPALGYRHSTHGMLYNVGIYGYYWSASPVDTSGCSFSFDSRTGINLQGALPRSSGFSVRCCADPH